MNSADMEFHDRMRSWRGKLTWKSCFWFLLLVPVWIVRAMLEDRFTSGLNRYIDKHSDTIWTTAASLVRFLLTHPVSSTVIFAIVIFVVLVVHAYIVTGSRTDSLQPSDWKALGDRFRDIQDGGSLTAVWNQDSKNKEYRWEIRGRSLITISLCTEMCKEAGKRFSDSKALARKFPEITKIEDHDDRWLVAIRQILGMGKVKGNTSSVQQGNRSDSEWGEFSNLTGSCQVLCSRLFNEESGATVKDSNARTRDGKDGEKRSGDERKPAFENRPQLFLEYSPVEPAYALTYSGLSLRNDGGTAHNVELEPETRADLTLLLDNPISAIKKGTSYPIHVKFCRKDSTGRTLPVGGLQSDQIHYLMDELAQRGENCFTVKIKCEDFEHNGFESCSQLRYDRHFDRISVGLC